MSQENKPKWPERNNEKDFEELEFEDCEINQMIGWNKCHDAFMSIINSQPRLERLDEDNVKSLLLRHCPTQKNPMVLEYPHTLAKVICSKFGTPPPKVEWPENPYPESVFPPMSEGDIKKLDDLMRKHLGYSIDRYSGDWGRFVFEATLKSCKEAFDKAGGRE